MNEVDAKRELRVSMKKRRREVPLDVRTASSAAICRKLLERRDVQCAIAAKGVFSAYLASADELDLSFLIDRLWCLGCKVVIPAWREDAYNLVEYSPKTELVKGPMGIFEPKPEKEGLVTVSECDVDVWIVPGLAFSRSGARLGYGGGWYDRFLSRASPSSISLGVAYSFQIVDDIPLESHDLPLSDIVWISV